MLTIDSARNHPEDGSNRNRTGVEYWCDPLRQSTACTQPVDGFRVLSNTAIDYDNLWNSTTDILFCPTFFHLPVSRECEKPFLPTTERDQAGALLHELIHTRQVVSEDTNNRIDSYVLRTSQNTPLVYIGWDNIKRIATRESVALPEEVASSYMYYALQARGLREPCSYADEFGLGAGGQEMPFAYGE